MDKLSEHTASGRNVGVDCLKMLSMFLVVVLHVLGLGGVLENLPAGSGGYAAAWLLECAAYCAVNCFALCSGYVSVGARVHWENLLRLWLQVAFYTLLITAVSCILAPARYLTAQNWLNALFPVLTGQYWYFTAYCGLFLLTPALNPALEKIGRGTGLALLLGITVLFTALPSLIHADPFHFQEGYSMAWVTVLYLAGGALRQNEAGFLRIRRRGVWLALFALCILATWGGKLLIEAMAAVYPAAAGWGNLLVRYTSPTIFLAAAALLRFFSGLQLRREGLLRLIRFFAPLAFSVYLIHVNPLTVSWYYGRLAFLARLPAAALIPAVLLLAAAGYLVCSGIDALRRELFRLLGVDGACRRLAAAAGRALRRAFRLEEGD